MSTEKNLNNLVINKVENQDVYDYMKANNLINSDELYLIEGNDEVSIPEATQTSSGLMSAEDKTRLDGLVATGGEANQNAFSNVVVGESIVTADNATDTLTFTAGNNITLTTDEDSNGVTIAARVINRVESQEVYDYMKKNNLLNSEELYFIEGANELATSTQVGLMSPEDKAKLDTVSENAEENVQADWSISDTTSDAYIKNKPTTLPANGGNSDTVNGHTVEADVPADAVFTDTVYTHPMYEEKSNGLYKIAVDDTGHISEASSVTKTDITALGIPAQDTTYSEATTTSAGLMSATDKARLDGLVASGGEANQNAFSNIVVGDKIITADNTTDTFTIIAGDNITLTPDEANNGVTIVAKDTTYSAAGASLGLVKTGGDATITDGVITVTALDGKVDKIDGKGLSTNDYTTTEKNKLAGIDAGANNYSLPVAASDTLGGVKSGTDITVDSSGNVSVNDDSHNHIVANVDGLQATLDSKVDKVDGKGLSTNDLTATLKSNYDTAYTHSQQAHAPADAEKNVIVGVQKNGTDLAVNSSTRKVNITVPTKTSELTNDSNFATTTDLANKVDKDGNKVLSTNDYTTKDKEKLAAIEDGANKTIVDSSLSDTSTNPVQNKAIYTKFSSIEADIDSRVPSSRTVNGKALSSDITLSASDVGALPNTTVIPSIDGLATETYVNNKVADLVDSAPGTLDTLNELAAALGDDPNFATTVANQIGTKVDKVEGKGLSTNDYTDTDKAKLEGIATGAQVNQNAFSNVIVGSITIVADDVTDSLTLAAGDNVTISADADNDKITISAVDTTYNEAGTELGLVKSGGDVTISNGVITVNDDSHNHVISNIDGLQAELDSKVDKIDGKGLSTNDLTSTLKSNYDTAYIHSQQAHNYAGSSTSGGAATSANKLNTDAGSTIRPVYFKDGVPTVIDELDSVAFDGYVTKGAESGSTIGTSATVEGGNNMASSKQSHAEGGYTRAGNLTLYSESTGMFDSYGYEHAEGYSTLAKKCAAHAEGAHTQAIASMAHAEGLSTIASGGKSHAEGHSTTASGANAHAEGYSTTASGENTHAEGNSTTASFQAAHAEGYGTTASGYAAHAEGYSTIASGTRSHTEGFYTKASSENQHVQGKYNVEDTADTYAHIVGNGTSDTARSNAYTLDWSGNAWFAGKVTSENADYAEVGQWADGNVNDEDRIGYFVAIDDATEGRTMVKATSTADVRGVTVDSPAFSGGYSADKTDSNGELLKQYDYVAVMGIVSVIDNGTCTVNGRCMPADDGTAIPSTNNLGYQIIERIDSTHVMIAIEPGADMIQRIKTDVNELQGHASAMDIHVTTEEKATWNAKADAPFKPTGKSYLTFSSPNSFTLAVNDATKHWDGTLEYFAEDKTWTTWDGTTTLSAVDNDGEYVLYLRGTGNTVITGSNSNYRWILTGSDIACIGNIENLLDYATVASGEHPTMANYCYYYMFYRCTSLTQAPALPATTLTSYCYSNMFYRCTSLTQAPALPATTLETECYSYMFFNCFSLTQAPALPATTLMSSCYQSMFFGCTSLTQAPELPATTLESSCYNSMFYGCTSLTQAPALSAKTLASSCYQAMFQGCTSLTQAPALPATTLETQCYGYMFYNCTSLTQAPALPATTLKNYCYDNMFNGCTGLKLSSTQTGEYTQEYRIPSSGTGTTATGALTDMFINTGGTFTGTPTINTTYYLSSDNMIVRETDVSTLNGYVKSMIDAAIGNAIGGSY